MTPREVIPAEISEEVEAKVSTALHKMVADERRFSTLDPQIEKLRAALREAARVADNWGNTCIANICRKALEDK